MAIEINWRIIADAMSFYTSKGYRQIEVPWIVPRLITSITCPWVDRIMEVPGQGDLVGSAEQSFICLDSIGKIGIGRFVACSPCFRNEPILDDLHKQYFMKVELYANDVDKEWCHESLLKDSKDFMSQQLSGRGSLVEEVTDEGFDLMLAGIEVGSYGSRKHNRLVWSYGTGVAEPRFSKALSMLS